MSKPNTFWFPTSQMWEFDAFFFFVSFWADWDFGTPAWAKYDNKSCQRFTSAALSKWQLVALSILDKPLLTFKIWPESGRQTGWVTRTLSDSALTPLVQLLFSVFKNFARRWEKHLRLIYMLMIILSLNLSLFYSADEVKWPSVEPLITNKLTNRVKRSHYYAVQCAFIIDLRAPAELA